MTNELNKRLTIAVAVFGVAVVGIGYTVWKVDSDVSHASPTASISAAPEEQGSHVEIFASIRPDLVAAIESDDQASFKFYIRNLRNRMLGVFVDRDEMDAHLQRVLVLDALLEDGFSGKYVIEELDILF